VLAITALLCLGIRVANNFSAVIVAIKLTVILLVIVAGLFYVKGGNLDPFIPSSGSTPAPGGTSSTSLLQDIGINTGTFRVGGIFSAAALVFFAYIGFDVVATAAEETKNPQRDLPIGTFGSLAICTVPCRSSREWFPTTRSRSRRRSRRRSAAITCCRRCSRLSHSASRRPTAR
jgi:APA family basic amino acid/polyamine antiporter